MMPLISSPLGGPCSYLAGSLCCSCWIPTHCSIGGRSGRGSRGGRFHASLPRSFIALISCLRSSDQLSLFVHRSDQLIIKQGNVGLPSRENFKNFVDHALKQDKKQITKVSKPNVMSTVKLANTCTLTWRL